MQRGYEGFSWSRVRRIQAVVTVMVGLLAAWVPLGPSHAATEWDTLAYDPLPGVSDARTYLPMPCGGRLTVLRIDTGSLMGDRETVPNWLADQKIKLGYAGASIEPVDYLQTRYVQGAFADADRNVRSFYIGKYEVSRAQYQAVMSGHCPDMDALESSYPVTGISWYDAVEFTRRYTSWLYAEAPTALPRALVSDAAPDESPAQSFIRLPTEEEWEFAARGGLKVTDDAFRAKVYPMAEGETLADHAWYFGPESSRGELNVIGLLNPNPLGLHDVLGNAEEFVLEPFRLSQPHRLHGQPGGFVTKGGSFRTPVGDIRTSRRDEYGYFDPLAVHSGDAARRRDTFGFRVAISAPVQVDFQRIGELNASYDAAAAALALDPGEADPLVVLKALADRADAPSTEDTINTAVGQLIEERGRRVELEGQALRAFFASGAMAGRLMRGATERTNNIRAALSNACDFCRESGNEKFCERCRVTYPRELEKVAGTQENAQNLYLTNLMVVADEFPSEGWSNAVTDTMAEIDAGGMPQLRPFAELFVRHVRAYQDRGDLDLRAISADVWAVGDQP